ncbi:MAG: hypothetical protein SVT56_06140 [Chloroflexota bacterium]|nr:hypothetical protein [Chloroflexota bacterium]
MDVKDTKTADDVHSRVIYAFWEYFKVYAQPPNLAIVHPYLCKEEHKLTIDGFGVTIRPGMIDRWTTWIGRSEE